MKDEICSLSMTHNLMEYLKYLLNLHNEIKSSYNTLFLNELYGIIVYS